MDATPVTVDTNFICNSIPAARVRCGPYQNQQPPAGYLCGRLATDLVQPPGSQLQSRSVLGLVECLQRIPVHDACDALPVRRCVAEMATAACTDASATWCQEFQTAHCTEGAAFDATLCAALVAPFLGFGSQEFTADWVSPDCQDVLVREVTDAYGMLGAWMGQAIPAFQECCGVGEFCAGPDACCNHLWAAGVCDCHLQAEPCASSAQCCVGECVGGVCQDGLRKVEGMPCASQDQCYRSECREGMCLNCIARDRACTNDTQCCSGNCVDSTGKCGDRPGCTADRQPCTTDYDCCNNTCAQGVCGGCRQDGTACTQGAQCCGGICTNALCRSSACTNNGSACSAAAECCANYCSNAGVCAWGPVCSANGSVCSANTDCCSGLCSASQCQTQGSTCALTGQACSASLPCCDGSASCQGGVCTVQAACGLRLGEPCSAASDCCSRYCPGEPYGRCQCAPLRWTCSRSVDCCNNFCDPAANLCCVPAGELAPESAYDCCSGQVSIEGMCL